MAQSTLFTTINLPYSGLQVEIFEVFGYQYFKALKDANGNSGLFLKYLITLTVKYRGVYLTEKQVNEMHARDITAILDVIDLILKNI